MKKIKDENNLLKTNESKLNQELETLKQEKVKYKKEYKTLKQINRALEQDLREVKHLIKRYSNVIDGRLTLKLKILFEKNIKKSMSKTKKLYRKSK